MGTKSDIQGLGILRRFWWDLRDRHERMNLVYWLIWQIPGATGNLLRAKYMGPRMKSAGRRLRIMAGTRFRSIEMLEVGNNVSIGFDNFLQAKAGLKLGNDVMLAPSVKIWTSNHAFDDPEIPVHSQGHTNAPVVLEDDVFVGSNAFILPGTTLSRGCIVSAGAVVSGKVYRPYSILGGNPARVIGYRGGMTPEVQAEREASAGALDRPMDDNDQDETPRPVRAPDPTVIA